MNNSAMQDGRPPRLLIVEFNEFEPEHLTRMAKRMQLSHLERVLAFDHSVTTTEDLVEHQGLDPWVQWVGVHCGAATGVHNIRRLGTTRSQQLSQIWNVVAARGDYTWGVWGVMNAPMGNPKGARFFMPDPWSFEEHAYPSYLNDVLALPRYAARNYLEMDYVKAAGEALRLARFFGSPVRWDILARLVARGTSAVASAGMNVHTLTTLLDFLSVLCFRKLRRSHSPNLSIIFLNHLAHLQHQFWLKGDDIHPQMKLGLELSNAMFGILLAERAEGEGFVLLNGLKQKHVAGEGFYVYRQLSPERAIEAIGVKGGRVEQNMTHDATIIFEAKADADRAMGLLAGCHLSTGEPAFFVERQGETRVFYQLAFEHDVGKDAAIVCGNYNQPFYDVFHRVCERTGAHVPEGDVYYDGIGIPPRLKNHEVFDHVLSYFPARHAMPVEVPGGGERVTRSGTAEVRLAPQGH
jgi:hypothetical protein